jgi:hypothetical protein
MMRKLFIIISSLLIGALGYAQDGVAPQCPVKGLDQEHRAFIPADVVKGFLSSHSIENYKWIFTIKPNQGDNSRGYVTPRK